jgi:bacteriorhodopsin
MSGLAGWGVILFEIFAGEAGQDASKANNAVAEAFTIMRLIVTVGWAIYPAGYFFGYLCGTVDASTLNLVYNLADFVNKIAFVLAIWAGAKEDSARMRGLLE